MRRTMIAAAMLGAMLAATPSGGQPRRGPPDLARYAGKYPFDSIGGVQFLRHPAVRQAVADAAPTARIRTRILTQGTSGPIEVDDRMILAWACEPHNCGPHQWSILIGRRSRVHIVCYQPTGSETGSWYRRGHRIATGEGCPSEIANVPAAVRAQL